jgi:hypothetical protein
MVHIVRVREGSPYVGVALIQTQASPLSLHEEQFAVLSHYQTSNQPLDTQIVLFGKHTFVFLDLQFSQVIACRLLRLAGALPTFRLDAAMLVRAGERASRRGQREGTEEERVRTFGDELGGAARSSTSATGPAGKAECSAVTDCRGSAPPTVSSTTLHLPPPTGLFPTFLLFP